MAFKKETSVSDYMTLVTTHECNRACKWCVDQYRGQKEFITLKNVNKALAFAKKNNIKDILLVGGEPTLHPEIVEIAQESKEQGFNTIMTTNYDFPDKVKALDGIVNSLNISYYGQKHLPSQKDFESDLTLSVLLFKGRFKTKEELDAFIQKYQKNFTLKFSTLTVCNDWTKEHQDVPFLDQLPAEGIVLFNEIQGQIYNGHIIKRYDRVVNHFAKQSYKCHVDGEISKSWTRTETIIERDKEQ